MRDQLFAPLLAALVLTGGAGPRAGLVDQTDCPGPACVELDGFTGGHGLQAAPPSAPAMGAGDVYVTVGRAPAVANVSSSITGAVVSSSTLTPTWHYLGSGATSSNWPANVGGDTLTAAGSGGTFSAPTPTADTAADLEGTRYYTGLTWDPGTNDLIFEGLFRSNATADGTLLDCAASGTSDALRIYWDATANHGVELTADNGTGSGTTVGYTSDSGTWQYFLIGYDRSANTIWAGAQGEGTHTTTSAAPSGGIDIDQDCTIGANIGGTGVLEGELASLRVWECAGCVDTGTSNFGGWANQRYMDFVGWDRDSSGFAAELGFLVRDSLAVADDDDGSGRLYPVPRDWIRIGPPPEQSELGTLIERAVENRFTNTNDLGTGWTGAGVTIGGRSSAGPLGSGTMHAVTFNSGTAASVTQVNSALNVTYVTLSAYVRPGASSTGWVAVQGDADANKTAFFDISSIGTQGCPVGTEGSGVRDSWTWPIDHDGDGTDDTCRLGITYQGANSALAHGVHVAEADNDLAFAASTGNLELYLGQPQLEYNELPSSFVETAGAAASRSADRPLLTGTGTVSLSDATQTLWGRAYYLARTETVYNAFLGEVIDDTAGAGDGIYLAGMSADYFRANAVTTGGGGLVIGSTNPFAVTGWYNVAATLELNAFNLYVNAAVEGTPDTAVGTITGNLDRIAIGTNASGSGSGTTWIQSVRLWTSIQGIVE